MSRIFYKFADVMTPTIIILEETGSTNSWLAANERELPSATAVMARRQTAGRGQRGNSWESEPGSNLTVSLLLRPEGMPVAQSFALSEAVAVGVAEAVERLVPDVKVGIKWPNDIYAGDRKLGGILIENSLSGASVGRSIVGLGLNINQLKFVSDAPNPVSIAQLTGRQLDVEAIGREVIGDMVAEAEKALSEYDALHERYMARLWRGKGLQPFIDAASGERFEASVASVEPTGHIVLRLADGSLRRYAFKEIAWPL